MKTRVDQNLQIGNATHIILLILSISAIFITNSYFKDQIILAGNMLYVPINILLIITSVYFLLEFRKKINVIALVSIVGLAVSWFVAEMVWTVYEMILHIEPFPSPADIFYMIGYPFLLIFLYAVGRTTRVPRQIQIISGSVGLVFLIPTIVASITVYGDNPFEFALSGTYTIFDALLIWIALNNVLTINNKQNHFWGLMFIGLALLSIADSFFIVLAISDEYYTGHPIEILFYCNYIAISYGLYYQTKTSKTRKDKTMSELFSPVKSISTNFVQNLILISSSVVIAIAVSLIMVLGFDEFTTNQATVFGTIMVLSVSIVAVLSTLTYVLGKKLDNLRRMEKKYEEKLPKEIHPLEKLESSGKITPDYAIPVLLTRIERLEKNNKRIGVITLVSVLLTTVMMGSYISENFFDLIPLHKELQSGKYVMETQKGTPIEKPMIWKIDSGEQLQINIIHADLVSSDKIDAIKNAILSEETIDIPNSEVGKKPDDGTSTYYLGWAGALKKAAERDTLYSIPSNFEIINTDESTGDIVIILSDQKQLNGDTSNIKTIVDEHENQIVKAYITIFDVKNLKNHDFDLIVKHELIRSLGNVHHMITDFISPLDAPTNYYISDCDVIAIQNIYDDTQNSHTCE